MFSWNRRSNSSATSSRKTSTSSSEYPRIARRNSLCRMSRGVSFMAPPVSTLESPSHQVLDDIQHEDGKEGAEVKTHAPLPCLLYTSDAADDLTRVDLG